MKTNHLIGIGIWAIAAILATGTAAANESWEPTQEVLPGGSSAQPTPAAGVEQLLERSDRLATRIEELDRNARADLDRDLFGMAREHFRSMANCLVEDMEILERVRVGALSVQMRSDAVARYDVQQKRHRRALDLLRLLAVR